MLQILTVIKHWENINRTMFDNTYIYLCLHMGRDVTKGTLRRKNQN